MIAFIHTAYDISRASKFPVWLTVLLPQLPFSMKGSVTLHSYFHYRKSIMLPILLFYPFLHCYKMHHKKTTITTNWFKNLSFYKLPQYWFWNVFIFLLAWHLHGWLYYSKYNMKYTTMFIFLVAKVTILLPTSFLTHNCYMSDSINSACDCTETCTSI